MSDWRPDFDPTHLYFVTSSAVQHTHLFQRDVIKRILIDALYMLRTFDQTKLYAFVVMPNHLHMIIQCAEDNPMKDVLRDFKINTARLIIWHYQSEGNQKAIDFLASAVTRPDRQEFKVWDDGYNAKDVFSSEFLRQKMDYIHNNPLQPHWHLAERAEDYIWSSARFYLLDQPALIPLDDARELF